MIRVKKSRGEKLIIVLLQEPFNPEICFIEYESQFPYFPSQSQPAIAVITVAPAVKYSFVSKGMQTRRTGQHKAELTLSPRLHVKPLITVITAIMRK